MITLELALQLQDAGLSWAPVPGDQFAIPKPDLLDDVFTLSDFTIEAHAHPAGVLLRFNGTTEWALDSVEKSETVWLPREDQLRDELGEAFLELRHVPGEFSVDVADGDALLTFTHSDASCAYAEALLYRLATRHKV